MADVLTKTQRRKNMQHIRSRDTKPEIVLRKALWHRGYRYRKNWKALPGSPDIVLPQYHLCIFVDSEFFHGKGFYGDYDSKKYSSLEEQLRHSSHPDFWLNKIQGNMRHDNIVDAELTGLGWQILRFWSHDVMNHTEMCLQTIEEAVLEQKTTLEPSDCP